MKTFELTTGSTLVVSVGGGTWQTITFRAKDFRKIKQATAEEIAAVLVRSGIVDARAAADGSLVIASTARGGHASLSIDLAQSTAAGALGISATESRAAGSGLAAAQLVSSTREPFPIQAGDELQIVLDGRKKRIPFERGFSRGKATAAQVVAVVNAKVADLATEGRDGQVIFTSPTVGLGSSLEAAGPVAAALGLAGGGAASRPHHAEPARIVCTGRSSALTAVNLTASPIELHFATGTAVLPARGALPLAPIEAAHEPLQRLVRQGTVRLSSGN